MTVLSMTSYIPVEKPFIHPFTTPHIHCRSWTESKVDSGEKQNTHWTGSPICHRPALRLSHPHSHLWAILKGKKKTTGAITNDALQQSFWMFMQVYISLSWRICTGCTVHWKKFKQTWYVMLIRLLTPAKLSCIWFSKGRTWDVIEVGYE